MVRCCVTLKGSPHLRFLRRNKLPVIESIWRLRFSVEFIVSKSVLFSGIGWTVTTVVGAQTHPSSKAFKFTCCKRKRRALRSGRHFWIDSPQTLQRKVRVTSESSRWIFYNFSCTCVFACRCCARHDISPWQRRGARGLVRWQRASKWLAHRQTIRMLQWERPAIQAGEPCFRENHVGRLKNTTVVINSAYSLKNTSCFKRPMLFQFSFLLCVVVFYGSQDFQASLCLRVSVPVIRIQYSSPGIA